MGAHCVFLCFETIQYEMSYRVLIARQLVLPVKRLHLICQLHVCCLRSLAGSCHDPKSCTLLKRVVSEAGDWRSVGVGAGVRGLTDVSVDMQLKTDFSGMPLGKAKSVTHLPLLARSGQG
jgi:hypothetical protein